jgi:hypothetical protein
MLIFYDKMFPIASHLTDYPDWRTDRLSMTLQNFDSWCSVNLMFNSLTYVREMKTENKKGDDSRRIKDLLKVVSSNMEIHNCVRVGLRCWFLHQVEMNFENLVALVYDKFLVDNEPIRKGICPFPIDAGYGVTFRDNGFDVRLRLGPMKREEIDLQFSPDRMSNFPVKSRAVPSEELFSWFPEVSLLMDIDVSRKDPKQIDLPNLYEEAQKIQSTVSHNIVKYVFGLKEN